MPGDRPPAAPRALAPRDLMPSAPSPEPNVTPMIDVLLVLLIIFMFMVAMNQPRRIDLQLPERAAEARTGASSIVLEVGPGGSYAVNRTPVAREALGPHLRALYADRPEKVLFVRGDPRARYQEAPPAQAGGFS